MAGKGTNGNGKGAPSLTQEQHQELLGALEDGVPLMPAFMAVGITKGRYQVLKERAEKVQKGELREFWNAIECARARGEVKHWRTLATGGKEAKGSLRVLEYSYGYTRTERQEQQVEHSGGLVIKVDRAGVTEADRPD